jgi:D-glycero-alpha-D-manno-heptose-7-phosphate kinase
MIITRTPLRVPLGGGGTDLPEYSTRFGSHLIAAAINHHVFVFVQPWFEDGIKIGYTRTEIVSQIDDIQHPVVREALRIMKIGGHIEILSMAELPSNTGLGSSGCYAVGLLNALHAYKGQATGPEKLAEVAVHLQLGILKEPGGKQDQYVAAYGGIVAMDIDTQGAVVVRPLSVRSEILDELESNLLYFYTGVRRDSMSIQREHGGAIEQSRRGTLEGLHRIKDIGYDIEGCLLEGDLDKFGRLLHRHWEAKRQVSTNISTAEIDGMYQIAVEAGSLGGKLIGAGGGGFLMLYCPNDRRARVRSAMREEGLIELRVRFESEGSKVLLNI